MNKTERQVLQFLADQGARFTKVNPKGKAPIMIGWEKSHLSLDEVLPWRETGGSIGIVCDSLAFLDVDDQFDEFLEAFPDFKIAPRVWRENANSGKILVRIAGKVPHKKTYRNKSKTRKFESLALGAHAVVMGTHKTGVPYKFSLNGGTVPEITSSEIKEIGTKWVKEPVQEYSTLADTTAEGDRNDDAYHNALVLARGGLKPSLIAIALRTWLNDNGQQEFTNTELEKAINSAVKKTAEEQTETRTREERDMKYALETQLPPVKWLVDGWIAEGTVNVLYGSPGACKTYSVIHLMAHVATGQPWLEKNVVQGNGLYIDEENGNTRMHDRFSQILIGAGMGPDTPLIYISKGGYNLDKGGDGDRDATDLRRRIERSHITLISLDSMSRIMDGDENVKKDVQPVMNRLGLLAEDTGVAIILQHHQGKDPKNKARGSSAIEGAVDSMVHITKEERGEHESLITFQMQKTRDTYMKRFSALGTWGTDERIFRMEPTDENVVDLYTSHKYEAEILEYVTVHENVTARVVAKEIKEDPELIRKAMERMTGTLLTRTGGGQGRKAVYKVKK